MLNPLKQSTAPVEEAPQSATVAPEPAVPLSTTQEAPVGDSGKKNNLLKILIPLVGVVVLAIIAFFVVNVLTSPAKVKEKVSVNHPLFLDLERTNEKIAKHLVAEISPDGDTFEREAKKGDDLVAESRKLTDELSKQAETMSGDLSAYGKHLKAYVDKSLELNHLEEESVKLAKEYVDPLKEYEELTVEISGASNYLYSDPAKYLEILDDTISREEKMISDLESLSLEGIIDEQNKAFIATLKSELDFLKEMRDAVEQRNNTKIASATKTYTENSQDTANEWSRLIDKLETQVDALVEELDKEADALKEEYAQLRAKFKF